MKNMLMERRIKEAKASYVREIGEIEKKHFKTYGNRTMSLRELDELCGMKNQP